MISKKLILLKSKIKEWVESEGGPIIERKEAALKELEGWHNLEEERDLEEEELVEKSICKSTLWNCLRMEEVEWRQHSRMLWLQEGDKNSKFFHRCANVHKAANTIRSIVVDGRRVVDKSGIRKAIRDHFVVIFRFSPLFLHVLLSLLSPPPCGFPSLAPNLGTLFPFSFYYSSNPFLHRPHGLFSRLVCQVKEATPLADTLYPVRCSYSGDLHPLFDIRSLSGSMVGGGDFLRIFSSTLGQLSVVFIFSWSQSLTHVSSLLESGSHDLRIVRDSWEPREAMLNHNQATYHIFIEPSGVLPFLNVDRILLLLSPPLSPFLYPFI